MRHSVRAAALSHEAEVVIQKRAFSFRCVAAGDGLHVECGPLIGKRVPHRAIAGQPTCQ